MSIAIVAEVRRLALPALMKAVYTELAWWAPDGTRSAWRSTEELALVTGMCERSVQRALRRLEEERLVVVAGYRHGGRGKRPVYRLCPERGTPIADLDLTAALALTTADSTRETVTESPESVTVSRGKGDALSAKGDCESSKGDTQSRKGDSLAPRKREREETEDRVVSVYTRTPGPTAETSGTTPGGTPTPPSREPINDRSVPARPEHDGRRIEAEARRLWGKPLIPGQSVKALELLTRYVDGYRHPDEFFAVMAEVAGEGLPWSVFIRRATERLEGTGRVLNFRAPARQTVAASGPPSGGRVRGRPDLATLYKSLKAEQAQRARYDADRREQYEARIAAGEDLPPYQSTYVLTDDEIERQMEEARADLARIAPERAAVGWR